MHWLKKQLFSDRDFEHNRKKVEEKVRVREVVGDTTQGNRVNGVVIMLYRDRWWQHLWGTQHNV